MKLGEFAYRLQEKAGDAAELHVHVRGLREVFVEPTDPYGIDLVDAAGAEGRRSEYHLEGDVVIGQGFQVGSLLATEAGEIVAFNPAKMGPYELTRLAVSLVDDSRPKLRVIQ